MAGPASFDPPRPGRPPLRVSVSVPARRARGLRGSFLFSLGFHVVLIAILFAGAPGPSRRSIPKDAKIITVSLASLPRAASGPAPAVETKGAPPKPTTVRQKKPPEEDKKPKVDLEKPKKKPKEEEKPEPPPVMKSNEPATKAVEPEPIGSPTGAERAGGPGLGVPSGGSGIGLSGAGTDTDFPFTYYLIAVRNKIAAHWAPPSGVSAGGAALKATIYFRILRGGSVTDAEVEQTSGVGFYDQSAVRAVQAAMPLPPLPEEFPDEYLGVHFDFQYVE